MRQISTNIQKSTLISLNGYPCPLPVKGNHLRNKVRPQGNADKYSVPLHKMWTIKYPPGLINERFIDYYITVKEEDIMA